MSRDGNVAPPHSGIGVDMESGQSVSPRHLAVVSIFYAVVVRRVATLPSADERAGTLDGDRSARLVSRAVARRRVQRKRANRPGWHWRLTCRNEMTGCQRSVRPGATGRVSSRLLDHLDISWYGLAYHESFGGRAFVRGPLGPRDAVHTDPTASRLKSRASSGCAASSAAARVGERNAAVPA